jgi:hypothetical protein
MNTLFQLQQHLAGTIEQMQGYTYKKVAPRITCQDGTTLSVQASENHYCTPRSNYGPYSHVEVWCVTAPFTEFDYNTDGEPASQVPIEQVVQFIDNHGGFKC